MCGIICEISPTELVMAKDNKILQMMRNRGPDCSKQVEVTIRNSLDFWFYGAVLWMQGKTLTSQPVENHIGVFLFNGDIYEEHWDKSWSDTQIIVQKLESEEPNNDNIIKVFKSLKGPFSLIYYCKTTNDIYFTRDRIGRNSLLFHISKERIILSSVLNRDFECVEIPATHLYRLNVESNKITLYPWSDNSPEDYELTEWYSKLKHLEKLSDNHIGCEHYKQIDLVYNNNLLSYMESVTKISNEDIMNKLMENECIRETVKNIRYYLEKSVSIRVKTQPNKCQQCLCKNIAKCYDSSVGILFSGGLDCTIIAVLADKYIDSKQSIDLINVSFNKDNDGKYEVPDRITGRKSYEELKKLCPLRRWIFKEINVPMEELKKYQVSLIADLVHPRHTILDESLGSALWFAARGEDVSGSISTCRVLLIGSGADELFGGYMRHRNAYKRRGWLGLCKELQLDWNRISFRNLARDNRVICDHGRQPRMPYLDEDFTDYVLKLDPWLKCFPTEDLGPGLGDKLMLRLLAMDLGLIDAMYFPKRALQFGTRIANKKDKGSDISKTFLKND